MKIYENKEFDTLKIKKLIIYYFCFNPLVHRGKRPGSANKLFHIGIEFEFSEGKFISHYSIT
jgi:hypothetical protein